ncbi:MAG TPA: amidohydrolase family protein [Caldilineae bacterium]|nr:amidohydrolase family protein [Caldilineae bacterium]HIQ11702.1 amidohydrolase [Caldilineales bacterium]
MRQVDTLITGGTVVTMNARRDLFSPGAVAIRGHQIVAVGPEDRVRQLVESDNVVDATGKLVIPGFVNAHTHVPMTLLRGLADDLRLDVWLLGYMMPVEREFVGPDFVDVGTRLGCAEMLLSGVTTFNDMYYYEEDVARAAADVGMRAVLGQTVLKFPSPDAASYEESLDLCRGFIKRWQGHELITPAIAPHAPYTTTDDILRDVLNLALEMDAPIHIHLSETALEVTDAKRDFGAPPIEYVDRLGLTEAKLIAAHCVHIEPHEIKLLAGTDAGVAHNPSSNLKLASGFAPVVEMREAGIPVGIGTDGPASNNDLDMFEEARLASFLPKAVKGDPTALPAPDVFAMMTIEGAKALHLDGVIGSLEAGKYADIVVVDQDAPHATPRFHLSPNNVYSHLVYAAHASDVRHVWVHGRQLVRDRELLTIDLPAVQARAREIAQQINDFMSQREGSLLIKIIAIGGFEQRETFEVQVKVRTHDLQGVEKRLQELHLDVVKHSVRQQFDTYFLFGGRDNRYLRYREDNELVGKEPGVGPAGLTVKPFYTLTLMEGIVEREYQDSIILTRSRYTAQATYSLRFYREYFNPDEEVEVVKWRTRYRVTYEDAEFAINMDHITRPQGMGDFVEIKARTWSASDAEHKADLISKLLRELGLDPSQSVRAEYVHLAQRVLA